MTNWKEVSQTSNPTWNPESGKHAEGKLVNKQGNIGPNKSNLYTLQQADGTKMGVWGTAMLDSNLDRISIGDMVKIEYLGKATNPKTGREYRNFRISVAQDTIDAENDLNF